MDISKQLQAYEVEYHVLQEELIDSSPLSDNQRMDKLEKTNSSLRKQNLDLLEQLQVSTCIKQLPEPGKHGRSLARQSTSRLGFPTTTGPLSLPWSVYSWDQRYPRRIGAFY